MGADISVKLEMDADDRALIERQCETMQSLIDLLKGYLSLECERDQRKIKDLMGREQKTTGAYTDIELTGATG